MNPFAVVILPALLCAFLLKVTADRLNLAAAQADPPPELKGIYDEERYRASQDYLRVRTRFGWWREGTALCILLLFWAGGGFAGLDRWVRSMDAGPIVSGLAYIGLLSASRAALSLPFAVYATFVIERRFGFNRTSPAIFAADLAKSALLSIALGLPVLAAVLALFEYTGCWAWAWAWAGVTGVGLVVQYLAPRWILPLFNTYTPLPEGPLQSAIMDMATSARFPLRQVFVIDGSRRSTKSNAFFTGFGANRRVALFDTLVAAHPVAEIVAVLAHEIGHYRCRHILQGMALSILHTGVVLFLFSTAMARPELYQAFGVSEPSTYTALVFLAVAYGPVDMVLGVPTAALSRRNEYQADRFAVRTTGQGGPLADALRTLASHNLSNLTPHPFYVKLHYSHPPLRERITAIEREAKMLRG